MAFDITRKELFQKVWERPMTKVAADYSISDVGLKKICKKHRIPVPGRGYWAKKAAGKKVKKAYYREVSDPVLSNIRICGSIENNLPEPVKKARGEARKASAKPENKIEVAEAPETLFSKVGKTRKKLLKSKPSNDGLLSISSPDIFNVTVGPESISRAMAFLNALYESAEARGFKIEKGESALVFLVDDEPLTFTLTEQTTRSKHVPTEKELAAIRKWERQQERRRYVWSPIDWTPRPDPPEWDFSPNGLLQVRIQEGDYSCHGIRRTFGDGKVQRIEKLINPLLEGMAIYSAAIKENRARKESWKREWEERERRAEEARRHAALEKKRIEALKADLSGRKLSKEILDYIAEVEEKLEKGECRDPDGVKEWIEWAKTCAETVHPLNEGCPLLLKEKHFDSWELR